MCYACGSPLPAKDFLGFRDACPDCGRPVHICRNCRFYKPGAHWDCAETVGEPVTDKEKGNFCEWFAPDPNAGSTVKRDSSAAENARSKFDDLFKR